MQHDFLQEDINDYSKVILLFQIDGIFFKRDISKIIKARNREKIVMCNLIHTLREYYSNTKGVLFKAALVTKIKFTQE